MSRNTGPERAQLHLLRPKVDARVRRTRDALGQAMVALMQEKRFEAITVQDVIERAGVARSTFYHHYTDKDDLLMSDADEFFAAISIALSTHGDRSDRVFPVKEFFAHAKEMREFFRALVRCGKVHDKLELAQGHFARGIARRFAELPRGQGIAPNQQAVIAFAQAGALLSMLTWWIDHDMRESPDHLDELFHRMVWMGVGSNGTE